jgi:HK97 family phage prohead protease
VPCVGGFWRGVLRGRPDPVVAAAIAPAKTFAVDVDPGTLYGVPTLDDYIFQTGRITRAEAMRVPAVKRARDLICGAIGQFTLHVLDPAGKPAVSFTPNLFQQPEPGIAPTVTWTRVVEDMLLFERSWLRAITKGWHGRVITVHKLDADTITVQPEIRHFREGTVKVWPEREGLIRIDSPNTGLLEGGRAIRACIALERAALNASDGAGPLDYFTPVDSVDPFVDDEEVQERLLRPWRKSRREGTTGYVPAAVKYNVAGWDPEKLQLAQAREFAVTEVARMTGIDARRPLGLDDEPHVLQRPGPAPSPDRGRARPVHDRDRGPAVDGRRHPARLHGRLRHHELPAPRRPRRRADRLGADRREGAQARRGPRQARPRAARRCRARRPRRRARRRRRVGRHRDREGARTMNQKLTFDRLARVRFEVSQASRTIVGLAVPFDVVGNNGFGRYRFTKGSLDWSKVKYLTHHDWSQAVGTVQLEETDEGLVMTAKIAPGARGDEVLALTMPDEDGDSVYDGLSIGLGSNARFEEDDDGVFNCVSASVLEVSGTPIPAFTDAQVRSVAASAAQKGHTMKCTKCGQIHAAGVVECQAAPPAPAAAAFDGEALMARVEAMATEVAEMKKVTIPVGPGTQLQVNEEPIYRFAGTEPAPSGFDFATDLLASANGDGAAWARIQKFTAGYLTPEGPRFVDTADAAEANQPKYRPDMFMGQAPTPQSPLYDTFHKGGLANVTPFFWTKLDRVSTDVSVHDHVEGVEPSDDDLVVVSGATVTPTAVSGKVHITREVADQGGNPQVSALVWSEFDRSFKIALETKTAALLNAAAAAVTALATIPAGSAGVVAGRLIEAGLIDLQFLPDGFRFTKGFGHRDLYKALSQAIIPKFSGDTVGEKAYPIINPQNRDGISGSKYSFIDLAGYRFEPAASLGPTSTSASNSWVADPNAVHVWNSGLTRPRQAAGEGRGLGPRRLRLLRRDRLRPHRPPEDPVRPDGLRRPSMTRKSQQPDPVEQPAEPEPVASTEAENPTSTAMVADDLGAVMDRARTAKVGDTVEIGGAASYVRLPDGTVVTCRGTYTPRHTGEHVVYSTVDGEQVETTIDVSEAEKR